MRLYWNFRDEFGDARGGEHPSCLPPPRPFGLSTCYAATGLVRTSVQVTSRRGPSPSQCAALLLVDLFAGLVLVDGKRDCDDDETDTIGARMFGRLAASHLVERTIKVSP